MDNKQEECKPCKASIGMEYSICSIHKQNIYSSPNTNTTMEERWKVVKAGLLALQNNEWWNSDEDFILSFIAEERRLVIEETLKEFAKGLLEKARVVDYADMTEYDELYLILKEYAKSVGISLTKEDNK